MSRTKGSGQSACEHRFPIRARPPLFQCEPDHEWQGIACEPSVSQISGLLNASDPSSCHSRTFGTSAHLSTTIRPSPIFTTRRRVSEAADSNRMSVPRKVCMRTPVGICHACKPRSVNVSKYGAARTTIPEYQLARGNWHATGRAYQTDSLRLPTGSRWLPRPMSPPRWSRKHNLGAYIQIYPANPNGRPTRVAHQKTRPKAKHRAASAVVKSAAPVSGIDAQDTLRRHSRYANRGVPDLHRRRVAVEVKVHHAPKRARGCGILTLDDFHEVKAVCGLAAEDDTDDGLALVSAELEEAR